MSSAKYAIFMTCVVLGAYIWSMHATLASYSPQLIAVGSVCVVLMKFR
ncbi:hypothetical protein KC686_01615 [Candidatus Woesebacteria bacterium]|nr:hypothetical protein [Candidatus Woesebacteria bacterium]